MTVSVDGSDDGSDLSIDPFLFEVPMPLQGGRYKLIFNTPTNLKGRRLMISTDFGGSDVVEIK